MLFTLVPSLVIADLGAGEGHLSQSLAKQAQQVIAVDNSEKMVEYGTSLAGKTESRIWSTDWVTSRIHPLLRRAWILCCSRRRCTMAARPSRALESARILKPHGKVAVLDLAHQFEQARELYADMCRHSRQIDGGLLSDAGFAHVSAEVVSRDEQNPSSSASLIGVPE
jgi:ArsR family transcriptional regulator